MDLNLNQMLMRARAVLKDTITFVSSETCLGATVEHGIEHATAITYQWCFVCDGPNHLARDCLACHQSDVKSGGANSSVSRCPWHRVKCYHCGCLGHFASMCSGNGPGEEASAPASSRGSQ